MIKAILKGIKYLLTESFRLAGGVLLLLPIKAQTPQLTRARRYAKEGQFEKAIDTYFEILLKNPKSEDALHELVNVALETGLYKTAHQVLLEATRYYPKSLDTLLNWGFYHQQQKQYEMSAKFFAEILKKDPGNVVAKYFLAALTNDQQPNKTPIAYVEYLFNHYAPTFDHSLEKRLNYRSPDNIAKLLKRHVDTPQRVLDLGCGTGLSANALHKVYPGIPHVSGVDASVNMLEKAREKNIYHRLYHEEINSFLDKCEEKFDLVVMCDVLPYFGDLDVLFKKIQTILSPGGHFCFCVERAEEDHGLAASGRYQHSAEYIESLLPEISLNYVTCQIQTMRHERNKPVIGLHYILGKAVAEEKVAGAA